MSIDVAGLVATVVAGIGKTCSVPNMIATSLSSTDRITVAVASGGLLLGIVVASLDSTGGLSVGLTLVAWNCVYGGIYLGRWHEARTIQADIIELAESERSRRGTLGGHDGDATAELTDALLHHFDREATEPPRLRLMLALLLSPNLFLVIAWVVTQY